MRRRQREVMFAVSILDLLGHVDVYYDNREIIDAALWRDYVWLDLGGGGGDWFPVDMEVTVDLVIDDDTPKNEERMLKVVKNLVETQESPTDYKRGTHVEVTFVGVMDSRPHQGIARVRPIGHPGWIAVVPEDALAPVTDDDD